MFLIVLLAYVVLLLTVSYFSYRKVHQLSDYLIAGKKGSVFSVSGSLLATILGGSAIIGTVDAGYRLGWAVSWFMLSAALGLFLLVPFASKVIKHGKYTLPDVLEQLLGPQTKLISSIIIPIAWTGIIAAQIIASSKILQSFIEIPYETGVWASAAFFLVYTLLGGQISILKTDKIQSILIFVGLIVVALSLSGHHALKLSDQSLPGFPFNTNFSVFDLIVLFFTYALTFTTGPDIYTRILSSKNEKVAINSVRITAIILIPVAIIIGYISVSGVILFPEKIEGSLIVNVSKMILPQWGAIIMALALLSAVLSSADTTLLSASIILGNVFQGGNYNEKSLGITRIFLVVLTLVSIIIALKFQSVITVLLVGLTVFSGAFTIPILFSFFNWKFQKQGVFLAIILGGVIALAGKIVFLKGYPVLGNLVILVAFVINAIILLLKKEAN